MFNRSFRSLVESSCRPSALLLLGVRGGQCCRAVGRESLVSWVVSVSVVLLGLVIIVYQGWSLEGVIVFLRGIVGALLSVILGCVIVPGIPGILFLVFRAFSGIFSWHGALGF